LTKFQVNIRTRFGEISVKGDSSKEVLDLIKEAFDIEKEVNSLIPEEKLVLSTPVSRVTPPISMKELEGIVEASADGKPQIIVPPERLTAKDVIGLLLYSKYPVGLSISELTELVSLSWKAVEQPYVAANLGQMKGIILKEGSRGAFVYKLSGTGKSWVENTLVPKLRGEKDE